MCYYGGASRCATSVLSLHVALVANRAIDFHPSRVCGWNAAGGICSPGFVIVQLKATSDRQGKRQKGRGNSMPIEFSLALFRPLAFDILDTARSAVTLGEIQCVCGPSDIEFPPCFVYALGP